MTETKTVTAAPDLPNIAVPASPKVAATFAAGTAYMWFLALFRLIGTYTTYWNTYPLYNASGGDAAGMWLYTSVIAVALYLLLAYGVFRRRSQVGTLRIWTVVFAVSVIVAPLVGEIGVPLS